jgi:hypothetical protein
MQIKECTVIQEIAEVGMGGQGCISIQHNKDSVTVFLMLNN